jgi:hypothetical protein
MNLETNPSPFPELECFIVILPVHRGGDLYHYFDAENAFNVGPLHFSHC